MHLIHLDVARTFPRLCMFQERGPYYDSLLHVLAAYACFRPATGYVQGMSFLAAGLLLYLDEAEAFRVLAGMLADPLLAAFVNVDVAEVRREVVLF